MSDLIGREQAIEAVYQSLRKPSNDEVFIRIRAALKEIPTASCWIPFEDLPSNDVEPVRHGRWIEENPLDAPYCRLIMCSECGKTFIVSSNIPYEDWVEGRNFCYSCGARMDGEQDG